MRTVRDNFEFRKKRFSRNWKVRALYTDKGKWSLPCSEPSMKKVPTDPYDAEQKLFIADFNPIMDDGHNFKGITNAKSADDGFYVSMITRRFLRYMTVYITPLYRILDVWRRTTRLHRHSLQKKPFDDSWSLIGSIDQVSELVSYCQHYSLSGLESLKKYTIK